MTVNPYKTTIGVINNSVNYHKQRSRSFVCKSFKNKYLNTQINLTYMAITAIIVL